MGNYLRSWGFSSQKPKKRAYEHCSEKVQQWLDTIYPQIKEKAQSEDAQIHRGGMKQVLKTVVTMDVHMPGKVKLQSKRACLGVFRSIGYLTVTNQGKIRFMIDSDTMNSDRFIEFMQQWIKGCPKKVYLILDNLRVHHSQLVKQWVEQNGQDGFVLLTLLLPGNES